MLEKDELIAKVKEIKEQIVIFNDLYHIQGQDYEGYETLAKAVKAYLKQEKQPVNKTEKEQLNTVNPNKIVIQGKVLELSEYERLEDE